MESEKIILEPLLTEKTNSLRDQNKYAFKVHPRANKIQIMKAAQDLFSVHPTSCNIMNVKGKPKRVRYRPGYTSAWKKAIITITPGESIDIFEGA